MSDCKCSTVLASPCCDPLVLRREIRPFYRTCRFCALGQNRLERLVSLLSALIQTGHDDLLMHINPTTTPIDNFHSPTLPQKLSRRALLKAIILLYVLYCRLAGTICGSTGEQNQFYARAHSGKKSRSCAVHLYFTMLSCLLHLVFIHRGASM